MKRARIAWWSALLAGLAGCVTDEPTAQEAASVTVARAVPFTPAQRDLRFSMSDLYFFAAPDPEQEVQVAAAAGMDDLWIAFLHERTNASNIDDTRPGIERMRRMLTAAHALGAFKVFFGLGQSPTYTYERPYVDHYIDASTTYSPRAAPVGDFTASTTGRDRTDADVRAALVGRDAPGALVAGVYWRGAVLPTYEPVVDVRTRAYRFRFPLLAAADVTRVPPDTRVATLRVLAEDHTRPGTIWSTLGAREVLAGDFAAPVRWQNFDVFVENQRPPSPHLIELRVDWDGAAGLALGRIRHEQWDPDGARPMLNSIRQDILRAEPSARFGRTVFDHLADLHAEVLRADPAAFDNLGGFWMQDEPLASHRDAWRAVADAVEAYMRSELPGMSGQKLFTTALTPGRYPNRYNRLMDPEEYVDFDTPILRYGIYMFPPWLLSQTPTREEPAYQQHIEERIDQWASIAAIAHRDGRPTQLFLDTRSRVEAPLPTGPEVALQMYAGLASGNDALAFWHIGDLVEDLYWGTPTPRPRYRFYELRAYVDELRPIKRLFDALRFEQHYHSTALAGHLVTQLRDLTGRRGDDLRVTVGQWSLNGDPFVMLVNRHTLAADALDLEATLSLPTDETRWAVDIATGRVLGVVTPASPTFHVPVGPGRGRLVGLVRPAITERVGDRDDVHPGDDADVPYRAPRVQALLTYIASDPGQDPGVDFDVGGDNRPVGFTHRVSLGRDPYVIAARLHLRLRMGSALSHNDVLYFNDSRSPSESSAACRRAPDTCARSPILPAIALRDLLGVEPVDGATYDLVVDLSRVPVRTVDTTLAPGGHWSATPDEFRDLRPFVTSGRLNLVAADDTTVDFSELEVAYARPGYP